MSRGIGILQRRIVELLAEDHGEPGEAFSAPWIAEQLGADQRGVRRALPRLVAEGRIVRRDWCHLRYYHRPWTEADLRAQEKHEAKREEERQRHLAKFRTR